MEDVARIMRENLPHGVSLAEFGQRMGWGRGADDALTRIQSLKLPELHELGLTADQAIQWALAYETVTRLMPLNPSAAGRAALLRHAANLLASE